MRRKNIWIEIASHSFEISMLIERFYVENLTIDDTFRLHLEKAILLLFKPNDLFFLLIHIILIFSKLIMGQDIASYKTRVITNE